MKVGLRILLSAVIFEAEKETVSTWVTVPVHSQAHRVCAANAAQIRPCLRMVWQCMPIIPQGRRQRQKYCYKFKARLIYLADSRLVRAT